MNDLKVLGFQLSVELDCNSKEEYLIETSRFLEELEQAKKIIAELKPDVVVLPEMCYRNEEEEYYKVLSNNMLVVAGSIYRNGINTTKVFQNGKLYDIPKCNASGAEPMIRNIERCTPNDFLKYKLEEHTFYVREKRLIVLNCMEYYQNAYYIARSVPDIFGIICICSNNNPRVFLEESYALHNHMENLYTFMINCVSTYQGKPYGKGYSYILGPIQSHEQEWLRQEGVLVDTHKSSILRLTDESEYFYGEFVNEFSRFGRSDHYFHNPKNIEIGKIRKKVL